MPWLEAETGADFMISAAPYQLRNVTQLKMHLAAGALLVQHKSGADLSASFGTRLAEAQARMKAAGARHAQCVLLYTGAWWAKEEGGKVMATLNRVDMGFEYSQLAGALARWGMRGGWVYNLPGDNMVPGWAALMLAGLEKVKQEPVKQVWPERERLQEFDPDIPLQLLETVTDGRVVLMSIPGVGPTLVNWLWEVSGRSLSTCLAMLTDETYLKGNYATPAPRNYSARLIQKVREFCRLGHYQALGGVDLGEIPF